MNNQTIKPQNGKKYYCITFIDFLDEFRPDEFEWSGNVYDRSMLELGTVYETEAPCKAECARRNQLIHNI